MNDEFFICVEDMADFELEVGWHHDADGSAGSAGVGTIGSTNVGSWNVTIGGFKILWFKRRPRHANLRDECPVVVRQ